MDRHTVVQNYDRPAKFGEVQLSMISVLVFAISGGVLGALLDSELRHGVMIGGTIGALFGVVVGGFLSMLRGKFTKS
jgi:hypothetical protein